MANTPGLDLHVFICTNIKDGKTCCYDRGSADFRLELKQRIQKHTELKGRVRINASGCLGQCANGIAAVFYPEGKWFLNLDSEDIDKLEKEVLNHFSNENIL